MKSKRVLTKKPLALTSVRLPSEDVEAWRAAAAKLDISRSEFLRRALRGISQQTLAGDELGVELKAEEGNVS
jgi:Arc/MetJ-type ribon-helix-helix transcriptional regulator